MELVILFLGTIVGFIYVIFQLEKLLDRVSILEKKNKKNKAEDEPLLDAQALSTKEKIISDVSVLVSSVPQVPQEKSASDATATMTPLLKQNPTIKIDKEPGVKIFDRIIQYVSTGNLPAKIGGIVLFVGVVFFLKYMAKFGWLSANVRLIASSVVAICLIGFGLFLRNKKTHYGLIIQGVGVGLLYIIVFIAYHFFYFFSAPLAFTIFILVGVLSVVLALIQNSRALIILAEIGGFITPILAAGHHGSYITLFSYYLILDSVIAIIAWFKVWRLLNLLGFLFTFILSAMWGIFQYQSDYYGMTQTFLIVFILLYVLISILNVYRRDSNVRSYLDGALLLGVPIAGFALQVGLTARFSHGISLSALLFAFFYAILAAVIYRSQRKLPELVEVFVSIAVVFFTLSIFFWFSYAYTGLIWSIEGLLLVWYGVRQKQVVLRAFGGLVILSASILYLSAFFSRVFFGHIDLFFLFNGLMISVSMLLSSAFIELGIVEYREVDLLLKRMLFVLGLIFWYGGLLYYFMHARQYELGFFTLLISSVAWWFFGEKFKWRPILFAALAIIPISYFYALYSDCYFISVGESLLVWVITFFCFYHLLSRLEKQPSLHNLLSPLHVLVEWLVIWRVFFITQHVLRVSLGLSSSWVIAGAGLSLIILWALFYHDRFLKTWSLEKYQSLYNRYLCFPLVAIFTISPVLINLFDGAFVPSPLSYLPMINPLDLMIAMMLLATLYWSQKEASLFKQLTGVTSRGLYVVLSISSFIWLTVMVVRSISYWASIPYNLYDLFESTPIQLALSITWSLLGMVLMIISIKYQKRMVWIIAASLLVLVVVKLLLIDLSQIASLARIISFIVVGVILLVIGYFAPIPPIERS